MTDKELRELVVDVRNIEYPSAYIDDLCDAVEQLLRERAEAQAEVENLRNLLGVAIQRVEELEAR